MKNYKIMATTGLICLILGAVFTLIGTFFATKASMNYRYNADKQRDSISLLGEKNKLLNEALTIKADETIRLNEELGLKADENIKLNKDLGLKTEENKGLIKINTEIGNETSKLAKTVNKISESILDKAEKLQFPITDEFTATYSISFQDKKLQKQLGELNDRYQPIFLDVPTNTVWRIDDKTDANEPFTGYYSLQKKFTDLFHVGGIQIRIEKPKVGKNLWLGSNYDFKKTSSKDKVSNISNRETRIQVHYNKQNNKLELHIKHLPIRITQKNGGINSLLELNKLNFNVLFGGPFRTLKNVKLESVVIFHNTEVLVHAWDFSFNENLKLYQPKEISFNIK